MRRAACGAVLGPVAQRIDDDLSVAFGAGRDDALQALEGDRYYRLLDALDELVQAHADEAERQFEKAWSGVPPQKLSRWLRG